LIPRTGTNPSYARHNPFTLERIAIEEAEFARCHTHDLAKALDNFGRVASSRFPLNRALGLFGLMALENEHQTQVGLAIRATETAQAIGARLVQRRAEEFLAGDTSATRAIFFC
jgi:hypothetical protein